MEWKHWLYGIEYKISGDKRNRENTRKGTKKDISTAQFSNLYCYHNADRNMASKKSNMLQWCSIKTKNSVDNRKIKQVVEEQEQNQFKDTLYQKIQKQQKIYKLILVISLQPVNQNEKKVKGKAIDRIRKRMKEDMQEKTKCCTMQNDKWEKKQYITNCKRNTIKDVIKIRLHIYVEHKMQLQKK